MPFCALIISIGLSLSLSCFSFSFDYDNALGVLNILEHETVELDLIEVGDKPTNSENLITAIRRACLKFKVYLISHGPNLVGW